MQKVINKSKKVAIPLFLIPLFVLGLVAGYFYIKFSKVFVGKNKLPTPTPTSWEGVSATPKADGKSNFNILLLGYGGGAHDGTYLTDSIIVANVNPQDKRVLFVTIPRDLWVSIPVSGNTTSKYKINAAYDIGGNDEKYPNKKPEFSGTRGKGALAEYVVGGVTGLPVSYFISIDFDGFVKSIDTLGGVDVSIPASFDDYFYPIAGKENETCDKIAEEMTAIHATMSGFLLEKQFICRYEHLHFEKGNMMMNGEEALKFVRSRHSDTEGTDFARSQRQLAVLVAVKAKLLSLGGISKFDSLAGKLADSVRTDMSLSDIKNIAVNLGEIGSYKVNSLYINTDNVLKETFSSDGQYILIPKAGDGNWTEIKKLIFSKLN